MKSIQRLCLLSVIMIAVMLLSHSSSSAGVSHIEITQFSTPYHHIGREALRNRTARIPVVWQTQNRPLIANLIFEQIMPDGSRVNVELPRAIPYVASSGEGIAAPILPDDAPPEIVLIVTMYSLWNNHVYDTAEIHLPIVEGNDPNPDTPQSPVPALISFDIDQMDDFTVEGLRNNRTRLTVSWEAINRPVSANLVFEQVLDDRVVNIELPRPFEWVNSVGSGIIAPVLPGDMSHNSPIRVRVRLVDRVYRRTLDQITHEFYVNAPLEPSITDFRVYRDSIPISEFNNGSVLVGVTWTVEDRPPNSNLVFEQVLAEGTRNAELPRDFVLIPDSGVGTVSLILPDAQTDELLVQLRLVDLDDDRTLGSYQIPIEVNHGADPTIIVEEQGTTCLQAPYAPSQGFTVGSRALVRTEYDNVTLSIYDTPQQQTQIGELNQGDLVTLIAGPACQRQTSSGYTRRSWSVQSGTLQGWVAESFQLNTIALTYYLVPTDQTEPPTVRIDELSISPNTVNAADFMTTSFTITWSTQHADRIALFPGSHADLSVSGTMVMSGSLIADDFGMVTEHMIYSLMAEKTNRVNIFEEATITIIPEFSMNAFSAQWVDDSYSQIRFSWDIDGNFDGAQIFAHYGRSHPSIQEITPSNASGSFLYDLPPSRVNHMSIDLIVTDQLGFFYTYTISNNEISPPPGSPTTCEYSWQAGISHDGCPSDGGTVRSAAYQAFQNGFLIWHQRPEGARIEMYAGGAVSYFVDNWDGVTAIPDERAPDGFFTPERGFGYLWANNQTVRSMLGWAVAPEQAYMISYQQTLDDPYGASYLTLPDGTWLRVNVNDGTWQRVGN